MTTTELSQIVLVDCNNFFVSCEKMFNPKLEGKAVVVLSNNDGIVIARSKEAKALGIPMGAAAFQYEELFRKYGVHVLSSNFSLYGDMSRRVMATLRTVCPHMEIYSVDEAFLFFDSVDVAYAREIKNKVFAWTGIPVSIGIAKTKTLSKAANYFAKKYDKFAGVVFLEEEKRKAFLEKMPVEEIWGIGSKLAERCKKMKSFTAWDFANMPDGVLKKEFSVVGLRLAMELRGESCLSVNEIRDPKKSISCAKSFPRPFQMLEEISPVLASYTAEVSEELRDENQLASLLSVWLVGKDYEVVSASRTLLQPSSYTPELVQQAKTILNAIYKPGKLYKKVGVMLSGLVPENPWQQDLFAEEKKDSASCEKEKKVMQLLDKLNSEFGKKSIYFAGEQGKEKKGRKKNVTKRFTTSWNDLLTIKI
jgi:DNA polymerase V